jgi:CubicO group peptidase (beta-lactamase class C family)
MKLRKLILWCLVMMGCGDDEQPAAPANLYFPPNVGAWETVTPASVGWNEAALPAFRDFLISSDTRALIVLKDGKIVLEEYNGKQIDGVANFSATSNWYWASAGKTLTSALVGIANAEGKINLEAKTSDYLGMGWTNLTPTQENKILVRHQLTMTTGLDDAVTNPDCTDKACLIFNTEPNTRWAYHNAPYTLLDNVIESATTKTLNTYAAEKIMTPIGATGLYLKTGDNNIFYSTARSMARVGLLLLNRGKWQDTQLIPESYVDLMTTTSQNINLSYGYLTWLNGKTSSMIPGVQIVFNQAISPSAPNDMFAAMGRNGQLINIVPSQNLVVIRMGDIPDNVLVPFTFQDDLWVELKKVITE